MRDDLTEPGIAARLKSDRTGVIARRLRKSMTPAEKRLWFELRRLPIEGSHFRRQAPFGPFIVGFVCHGARLIIEVDGGSHNAPNQALRDLERQTWIEGRGYKVMRFSNERVASDAEGVAREVFTQVGLQQLG